MMFRCSRMSLSSINNAMLTYIQFLWAAKKLEQEFKPKEIKPDIVSIVLCIDSVSYTHLTLPTKA